jgi:hypothetical protein
LVPEAPALCCGKKHLACRTENGALYGRANACRQRLQQLEVGASLAFILARVAAWGIGKSLEEMKRTGLRIYLATSKGRFSQAAFWII